MIQEVQRLSCVAPQTIPHRLYLSTFASYVCFLNTFYVCRFYFGLCNKSPMKGDKGCDPGGLQHPKRLLCLGKPDWLYAGSRHFGLPTIRPLFGLFHKPSNKMQRSFLFSSRTQMSGKNLTNSGQKGSNLSFRSY